MPAPLIDGIKYPAAGSGTFGWNDALGKWQGLTISGGGFSTDIASWGGVVVTPRNITPDIAALQSLIDETIKGLLRSFGDAGAAPSNVAGKTLLKHLDDINSAVASIGAAGAGATNSTGQTLLKKADRIAAALDSDAAIGVLRSIGDSGAGATNIAGKTVLKLLDDIVVALGAATTQWNPLAVFGSIPNVASPLVLDTGTIGGRNVVNTWLQNTQACVVNVEVSPDGTNWVIVSQRTIPAAPGGADFFQWFNAFQYIRLMFVSSVGGTIYGRIAASR